MNTGCSVTATPSLVLKGNVLCAGVAQRQAEVIQPSIRARIPSFLEGEMITGLFMVSGAVLTFCKDHEWRSGVTEVPGEPAPPAKVVFTELPKSLHSKP